MYISELELQGFKSFAHKTKVSFDSGITSIVGPNGCGKSNIVDALRWVLGEQRPSLLRSSAMSNVIFNGTAKKKALGMAEVSLTFVNDKGILPIEYSELTITRRLYRSGDSEYLINGTPCRLKDIMELFMDTGMGSDAYSVIELKMVEEILNDKNNDRRKLFEEAAGVTRYKDQRKRSLRKLEETRKDLQRVDDLLVELRKKTRSLEIQAEKVTKAKGYRDELEQLDKALTHHEYARIQAELNPLLERVSSAEKEKEELQQKLITLEHEDEQARKSLLEKERHQAEAQRRVQSLQEAVQEANTQIRIAEQKIESEKKVLSEYDRDIQQGEKDRTELQKLLEHSREKLEEFATEQARSDKSLEDSKVIYTQTQQQYSKERHEIYELEVKMSAANNELSQLQAKRIKIESRLENTEGDLERIQSEISKLNEEISLINQQQKDVDEELEKALCLREKREKELEHARAKKDQFTGTLNETKDQIRGLKSELASIQSESRLLQDLAQSNEAFPSSVQYLLEEHRFSFQGITTVGDVFSTEERYGLALESALGPMLNYLVVDTMEQAIEAAALLKEHEKGLATFIPLQQLAAKYEVNDKSLFHQISAKAKYSALKQLLLGSVILFESSDELHASELTLGQTGVSLQGDVKQSNSFYTSGSKSSHAGIRVSLKTKIERLEKQAITTEKELQKLEDYLQQIAAKSDQIDLQSLVKALKEQEQVIRTLEQQKHSMSSKVQVYQKNISNQVNRKDSLQSNEGTAQQELASIAPNQQEIEQQLHSFGHELEQKKKLLESLEDQEWHNMFEGQWKEANIQFSKYIELHYQDWIQKDSGPILSHNAFQRLVYPHLSASTPTLLIVIDNLRLDQLQTLLPSIEQIATLLDEKTYYSLLPTTTQYARNSFFAGLTPLQIQTQFPTWWVTESNEIGKNLYEEELLKANCIRLGYRRPISYHKVIQSSQGHHLVNTIQNHTHEGLTTVVYNFVDMISHAKTDMNIIKELTSDNKAYRSLTHSWFKNSSLIELIKKALSLEYKVILTTDHGTINVDLPSSIIGDKETNLNLRYKTGKSLTYNKKDVYTCQDPKKLELPTYHINSPFIFAKANRYFVYKNNYNHFVQHFKNTYQHGGISMEEMILPFVVLRK